MPSIFTLEGPPLGVLWEPPKHPALPSALLGALGALGEGVARGLICFALPLALGAVAAGGATYATRRLFFGKRGRTSKRVGFSGARRSNADYALVRASGMDDTVLSVHRTKEAAENAMRRAGGEPSSLFTKGMRVVNVASGGPNEMIEIFGKRTIRRR